MGQHVGRSDDRHAGQVGSRGIEVGQSCREASGGAVQQESRAEQYNGTEARRGRKSLDGGLFLYGGRMMAIFGISRRYASRPLLRFLRKSSASAD